MREPSRHSGAHRSQRLHAGFCARCMSVSGPYWLASLLVYVMHAVVCCICVRSFSPITSTPGGKCPEMCEQLWPSNMSTGTNFPGQTVPHLASSIDMLYIGRF